MSPILEIASDGQEHFFRDAVESLAVRFGLTDDERQQPLPSRTQPVFDNRVGWARTYLVKAGLLESPRRGYFCITQRGKDVLRSAPPKLDSAYLRKHFREFQEFVRPQQADDGGEQAPAAENSLPPADSSATPEEALESAYQNLRRSVESDVLARLHACSPAFFERVVVRLLVAMGYGGTLRDAGAAIGRSGDEGIDGIIKEDRLGLDVVYVQAKKWTNTVGRPDIQKFAGALQGQRARKGVFIATSTFSADARQFVAAIEAKIVLIDGQQLAQFMFEHNVGVAPVSQYDVKKIDADFFEEE
jgi:restriction system protein